VSYEEAIRSARAHADDEAFERAWGEGRVMSAADAVTFAIGQDGGRPS
jgi:hypothetical protein